MKLLRATGASLVLVGLALLLLPAVSSAQETTAPAEFGSFTLLGRAPAIDVIFDDETNSPAHPAGQGAIPEAVAKLEAGPIGLGFASLAWPGPLAGNLGSLIVIGGGPKEAEALNDPVRAEAHAPAGPADAKMEPAPGTVMVAHAEEKLVTATGTVSKAGVPGSFGFGQADGTSRVELKGGKGLGSAVSRVTDFELGVLKIGSVVSEATGSTDGVKATGGGKTVASGVTVAGQPATIDEKGLRFGEESSPNPIAGVANEVGASALKEAGITIAVSKPDAQVEGAGGTWTAGSVIVQWDTPEGQHTTFALGGASVSVTAAPGFDTEELLEEPAAGGVPAVEPAPVDPGGDAGVDTGEAVVDTGADTPAGDTLVGTSIDDVAAGEPVATDAEPIGSFGGIAPAAAVLAIGASLFIAGTIKRLPDAVLTAPGSVCNLEEEA